MTYSESGLRVLSLFAGIGGIDLGLERAGMKVVAHSEVDPYACRVLAKHWPGVPNLGDITEIEWSVGFQSGGAYANGANVGAIDVIAGGFPCQDISYAGKGAGINEGTRSGLWSHYARAIRELRPRYVIVENVPALLSRGLGIVLGDLASCGYDAEWDCVPASAFGAPHRRDRLFVIAYPSGCERKAWDRVGQSESGGASAQPRRSAGHEFSEGWRRCGAWLGGEPDVERVVPRLPDSAHRLKCLGNSVVPQVAEFIGGLVVRHSQESQVAA